MSEEVRINKKQAVIKRFKVSCPNGHVLYAKPKVIGQVRQCPKCNVDIIIKAPGSAEEGLDEICDVLFDDTDTIISAQRDTHSLKDFRRPPKTSATGKQRRCPKCKTLNPVNYRQCAGCGENLSLVGDR